jgi:hypothetical protein
MKHWTLDETTAVEPIADESTTTLTRRERLERWAEALERHQGRVMALFRLEYLPPEQRMLARGDDTPLAVAFADPVLRASGLASDRYGDAIAFFELSDSEAHRLLCDCHYHGRMSAEGVAARLRAVARRPTLAGLWRSLRAAVARR